MALADSDFSLAKHTSETVLRKWSDVIAVQFLQLKAPTKNASIDFNPYKCPLPMKTLKLLVKTKNKLVDIFSRKILPNSWCNSIETNIYKNYSQYIQELMFTSEFNRLKSNWRVKRSATINAKSKNTLPKQSNLPLLKWWLTHTFCALPTLSQKKTHRTVFLITGSFITVTFEVHFHSYFCLSASFWSLQNLFTLQKMIQNYGEMDITHANLRNKEARIAILWKRFWESDLKNVPLNKD